MRRKKGFSDARRQPSCRSRAAPFSRDHRSPATKHPQTTMPPLAAPPCTHFTPTRTTVASNAISDSESSFPYEDKTKKHRDPAGQQGNESARSVGIGRWVGGGEVNAGGPPISVIYIFQEDCAHTEVRAINSHVCCSHLQQLLTVRVRLLPMYMYRTVLYCTVVGRQTNARATRRCFVPKAFTFRQRAVVTHEINQLQVSCTMIALVQYYSRALFGIQQNKKTHPASIVPLLY